MKAILVILDTLRRDVLLPYGGTGVHAPNIGRLAERSVVCDQHWAGSLPCMPARRELMTGRHNFLERGWGPLEPFDDVLTVLLRQVQPRKVFSHLISDHYHYFYLGGEGFNNAFDTWQFERGQENDFWVSRVDLPALPEALGRLKEMPQHALNRFAQRVESDYSGPRCVRHAIQWLDDNRESDNWFLQLELFDPHEPFYAPKKYREMYGDRWRGPVYDWPAYGVCDDSPEALNHIRVCYVALLKMIDTWLGKLWDKLDELDAWKDTMVVLTTDHGTMLGEHGYYMKNVMPVYNEIARIPMIVHLPGSRRAGTRVAALTQTTDLMPTFLDYFGVPAPPHVHGASLRPVLEGDASVHDSVIYGYFGMALNAADGRYTYFRNPVEAHATVHAYTSMPVQFHGFMPREQLARAEIAGPLPHTYGMPLYRVPQEGRAPLRDGKAADAADYQPRHELYDIEVDPGQQRPLDDPALEARFCDLLRGHLDRVAAPKEHWARLGL